MKFADAILYDDKFLFYDADNRCMWEMDMQCLNKRVISRMEEAATGTDCGGGRSFLYKTYIYITSFQSANILAYDIVNKRFECVENPHIQLGIQYNAVKIENKLFLLPILLKYPVFIFDMESRIFVQFDLLKYLITGDEKALFVHQQGACVWIPVEGADYLYKLDGRNFDCELIQLPKGVHASVIDGDEKDLWIACGDGFRILHQNGSDWEEILLNEETVQGAFSGIVQMGNKVVFLPRFAKDIYVYGRDNKKIDKISLDLSCWGKQQKALVYGYTVIDNKIYLWPWGVPDVVIFDVDTYSLDREKMTTEISESDCAGMLLYEDTKEAMHIFCDIQEGNFMDKRSVSGKEIWEICKDKI